MAAEIRVVVEDKTKVDAIYVKLTNEATNSQPFKDRVTEQVLKIRDPPWQCAGVRQWPTAIPDIHMEMNPASGDSLDLLFCMGPPQPPPFA